MSYLVLARKYRPKTFTQMVGQPHVVQALTNALTQQRLHHAYLFTGTRGVGKTTVSRILAKSLNCVGHDGRGGVTAQPCGQCQPCRDIDADRFVDYTEMDAASNRGVDEVQALLEQAVYKPVQGRFKVFMIDEVHMLTSHAFNAMLKTLEEPPEYLKFVLATTDPQKVPVTVLSRCLQFSLRPMAPETVQEHLAQVLANESVQAQAPALRLIARAARGSMRDALSLTDQAIAFGDGRIDEATVRQMLGAVDQGHAVRLIEALATSNGQAVVQEVSVLREQGMSAASTLEEMATVLQQMAVVQCVPSAARDADTDQDVTRLAALLPSDETQLLYSLCLQGRAELGLAPDEYAGLTMVLLRLLAFKPAPTVAAGGLAEKKTLNESPAGAVQVAGALAAALPASAAQVRVRPAVAAPIANPAPAADAPALAQAQAYAQAPALAKVLAVPVRESGAGHPASPAADMRLEPSAEGDFWFTVVERVILAERLSALTRELALQSQLVARDTDHWLLRVESESLAQQTHRERLAAALAAQGYAVSLGVEIGTVTDSPVLRRAAAAVLKQQQAETAFLADPYVQTLVREFEAKIVPGSLKAHTKATGV